MNIKAFFVDALSSALELGIGTPEDVIRHVTPDVLAAHLPRPLWARLFTACLGAARVDAQLIVETIGIPNLCEHLPATIIWACVAEIGARSLGKTIDVASTPQSVLRQTAPAIEVRPRSVTAERAAVLAPPPDERPAPAPTPAPIAVGPSIPAPAESLADVISDLEATDEPRLATLRPRSPTAQRFRQSNTGVGRIGNARRPQAAAVPTPTTASASSSATSVPSGRPRREMTEVEPDPDAEPETRVGDEWRQVARDIAVDDSQLVDWQATDGAGASAVPTVDEDFSDLGRKR